MNIKKIFIRDFSAILFMMWISNGILSYVFYYVPIYIKISLFLVWISMCISKSSINKFVFRQKYIILFILVLYLLRQTTNLNLNYMLKTSIFFFTYSCMLYFYKDKSIKVVKRIIYPLLFDFAFIGINTLIKLKRNPNIARFLSHDSVDIVKNLGEKSMLGIGNYNFAYSLVVITLISIYLIKKQKQYMYFFCFVINFILLIKMQFTISILLNILAVFLEYILLSNKKRKIMVIFSSLLIFACLCALELQYEFIPNNIKIKINNVIDFLIYNKNVGYFLNERLSRYMMSLNLIKTHYIFGLLNGSGTIGNHSTWFDLYAQIGVVSLFLYIHIMKIMSLIYKINNKVTIVFSIYWIILGCINVAYTPKLLLSFVMVLPCTLKLLKTRNSKINYGYKEKKL